MTGNKIETAAQNKGKDKEKIPVRRNCEEVTLEEIYKAWRTEKYHLNGKDIETYGVLHDPMTLEVPKMRHQLLSAIDRASVVLSEGRPVRKEEKSIDELVKLARSSGTVNDISDSEIEKRIRKQIFDNPNKIFYDQIAAMAANKRKKVAVTDPLDETMEKVILLAIREGSVDDAKFVAALTGLGLTSASIFVNQFLNDRDHRMERPMTRRTFLKLLGGGAASLATGNILSMMASKKNAFPKFGRAKNPLGAMFYTLIDYRDAAIAEGLEKLTRKDFGDGPIVMIYGAAHPSAIRHYATHPTERKAKLASYLPFRGIAPPETELFEFDGKWKLLGKL